MRQLAFLIGLSLLGACDATAQGLQGVHPETRQWEVGVGYALVRFYEVPQTTTNNNGFTFSGVYYGRKWLGADIEFTDTFGTQAGESSQLLFTGGGPRFRSPTYKTLQLWVHGLVGYSRLTPRTPYGGESALGYEAGGGIDLVPHHSRVAYRLAADMIGTRFFGTYQYSPKVSAGVVFRF
jgi:hypothetical protein